MEAELLDKSENLATIYMSGVNPALVNAIRRAILKNVNTIAIEDVTVYKNTSVIYDEVLALRLGLIPLKTIPELNKKNKEFTMKLTESGPKTVYASDLKSSDKDIKPVYDNMIIMKLNEGEKIDLEAKAVFGNGSDHTKFTPAHVYYHFQPIITTTKSDVKGAAKIASLCPVNILDGTGNHISVKKGQLDKCILCMACEDYAGEGVIKVSSDPEKTIFGIESWGQLSIPQILEEALDSLEEEAKEILKAV